MRTASQPSTSRPGVSRRIGVIAVVAVALTVAMAWPVLLAPRERIFGLEIAGRHHDPFTVMTQMASSGPAWPFVQPMTDWLGWLFARVLDPVAAYNLLVLMTFPLATMAAWALARYLGLSSRAAAVAGLAYGFAPLHLAHAAYHPHVAQAHWLPLYLLGLCAAIDTPSLRRLILLVAACAGLVLADFYAGLIGAVVTPVVLVGYWWTSPRADRGARNLWRPCAVLACLAGIGLLGAAMVLRGSTYAAPVGDLARYSALWWSYFTPPAAHPVFGDIALASFDRSGTPAALIEQQVSLSYALLVLAAVALVDAGRRWRRQPGARPLAVLAVLAVVAALVSLGPGPDGCRAGSWVPACRLHDLLPMFRAYARFAFATHLAVAVLAGAGAAVLWRGSRATTALAVVLLSVASVEYLPLPARTRDVLPTSGHRWLARTLPEQVTLDCIAPRLRDATVPWLMKRRLHFLGAAATDCSAPDLASRLAVLGYTHVLIRHPRNRPPVIDPATPGFAVVADFDDSRVYAVTAEPPAVVTLSWSGFFDEERSGDARWRWMGPEGRWQVRNTTDRVQRVVLELWIESAHARRSVTLRFSDQDAQAVMVEPGVALVTTGPWVLGPGDHTLTFAADGEPFQPSNAGTSMDTRRLTVAIHASHWRILPDE